MKALIAGATGLIGKELLQMLLEDDNYTSVHSLVRKPTELKHSKLKEFVVDFDQLQSYPEAFALDDVFCCLGTTMKKAGTKEAFRKVDYDYPLAIAEQSLKAGAKQYLIVTAMGSDASSRIFYNKVKGEIEQDLKKMPFESLLIFRPSLLLGDRNEKRVGEDIGKVLMKLIPYIGPLKKYKPILGKQVAFAMQTQAKNAHKGIQVFESGRLQEF
jgi:uncharacterized protein YbjT (DUF2867 family)